MNAIALSRLRAFIVVLNEHQGGHLVIADVVGTGRWHQLHGACRSSRASRSECADAPGWYPLSRTSASTVCLADFFVVGLGEARSHAAPSR